MTRQYALYALASCLLVVAIGCGSSGGGGDSSYWQGLPSGPAVSTPSRVHGVVTNQNGEPVKDAAVSALIGTSTVALVTSAADGSFALSLAPGGYVLSVARQGYAISRQSFSLAGTEDRLVVATLGPRSTLAGKVLLSTTKELLANIDVRIYDATGLLMDTTRTNIEGVFTFQDLAIGRYDVALAGQSPRYALATYVVQILNDGTLSPASPQLLLSLAGQASRVHGVVNSPTGLPVAGAAVSVISGITPLTIVSTGNDGTFSLQVPPGSYTLNVAMAGFAVYQQVFSVGVGDDRLIMATLGPRSTVRGTVLLASTREALANINVVIYDIVGTRRDATRTNVEGVFIFQDLAVGRYNVALVPDSSNYGAATYTFQILNDGTVVPASPEFLMTTIGVQGRLRGTVTNLNGLSINGAAIQVSSGASVIAVTRSVADGSFSLQMAVGTYSLQISMTNYGQATKDNVAVTGGNDPLTVIALGPRTAVTGRVLLNSNREALPNIDVTIVGPTNSANPSTITTLTNISGYFNSENLSPGNYQISLALTTNQYVPATFTFQVLSDGTVSPANQEYLLARQVIAQQVSLPLATGTVRDAYSMAPLEYVTCTLRGVGNTTTDNHGQFLFNNLLPGTYQLVFDRAGWDSLTVSFAVQSVAGSTTCKLNPSPLDLVLTQTVDANRGSVSGRYVDEATQRGVNDLAVRVYRYTHVTQTITWPGVDSLGRSATFSATITDWTLDSANPAPIISTRTGSGSATLSTNVSDERGTFRISNLLPTDSTSKYVVFVATDTTSQIRTRAVLDPRDNRVVWYQEDTTVGTRRHSWSQIDVSGHTTTYLTNYDLPNTPAPSVRNPSLDVDFSDD